VIAGVRGRPARHLGIVQVRIHVRIVREEPRVDPACNICGVLRRTVDRPGERIVEDSIGHGVEGARVVDRADIWVELVITIDVWACDPNYAPNKRNLAYTRRRRWCEKVRYLVVVSALSYCLHQYSLAKSLAHPMSTPWSMDVDNRPDILWCPAEIVM